MTGNERAMFTRKFTRACCWRVLFARIQVLEPNGFQTFPLPIKHCNFAPFFQPWVFAHGVQLLCFLSFNNLMKTEDGPRASRNV